MFKENSTSLGMDLDEQKRQLYLSLQRRMQKSWGFIGPGKKPCKKALGEQSGVSFAFDLNTFADGRYQYFAPRSEDK